MNYASLALKLAPWAMVAALITAVLWMRTDLTAAHAATEKAQAAAAELAKVNDADKQAIADMQAAREANDKAVAGLNAQVSELKAAASAKQTVIQKVFINDPKSRAWADMPVPDELRGAVN